MENDLCGGLGDRLKGLVSTAVLALLLDAHLAVDWTYPVQPFPSVCSFTFLEWVADLALSYLEESPQSALNEPSSLNHSEVLLY
jgi:hypothetical protein